MIESNHPVLAEVLRKGVVESIHRGSAVVVDQRGDVTFAIGKPGRLIFPRSSLKFFQALPIIESGAADAYGLTDRQLALACASHNAEPMHVDAVSEWLGQLQLGTDDLECGPTLPLSENAAHALIASGVAPTRLHQNCSGKHCGMLTVSRHLGVETRGYSEYTHPSQQAWLQTLGELTDVDASSLHWERDGCGLPAVQLPAYNLALGFARYASPDQLGSTRATAVRRILSAIGAYPEMVAGTGRCCTAVMQHTRGKVLVKTGAEGVYGGLVPSLGIGFALKADDGATRASEVMLGGLLQYLGVLDVSEQAALAHWFRPSVMNSQGYRTGEIVPSGYWLERGG